MKLLRVSGSNNRSIINTNLNHPLSIEPYSKIALESVSFEVAQNQFIVDANNNKISYQNEDNVTRSILLTQDIYDKTNYNDLLTDIEDKLNISYGITDYPTYPNRTNYYDIGLQARVYVDNTAKTIIQLNKNSNFDYINNSTNSKVESNNVSFTSKVLNSTLQADTSGFNSYVNINSDWIKGCGSHIVRINQLQTTGEGFIIGLVENRNIHNNPVNSIDELTNYIWVKNTTEIVYKTRDSSNGSNLVVNLNIDNNTPTNNTHIGFILDKGTIKFVYYNHDGSDYVVNNITSVVLNRNSVINPVIYFKSIQCRLDSVRLNLNPYKADKAEHFDDMLGGVPKTQGKNTNKYLEFDNIDLANYLGFEEARYPQAGTYNDKLHTYEAENPFRDEILSDNYLIELLTFDIESYISNEKTGEKMNILSNIPRGDESGGIYYNPNNLIWIDLNNKESILLRNFNFRLLDEYLDNVITKNNITLTLLFKNENE